MTQLEKHEKAIKLLNAIKECYNRIFNHKYYLKVGFTTKGSMIHHLKRIEINTAIKTRLEAYYNKSFKI